MKRWSLLALVPILIVGCSGPFSPDGSYSQAVPNGSFGATPGGTQDLALARELIAGGVVPPADALIVEGIFSEYDLPLEGPECETLLCIRGALGWQDESGWLQLGLSSNVDMESFTRPSLGLVLLVDVSGSMGWDYGEYGRPAKITHDLMTAMVEHFDSDDVVGMAAFASSARLVQGFVSGDQHDQLNSKIAALTAGGSTNMEAGLRLVISMFDDAEIEADQKRVILLTDAQPNVGATSPGTFMELAGELEQDGIGLTIIGTGIGLNPDVMQAMVNLSGGNGFSISTAGQVPAFMDDNWPWMICPIAYDLTVVAQPVGGFTLGQGYGFPADQGELRAATVFLSRRRGALLLRFDGGPFEQLAADLRLRYRTPAGEPIERALNLQLPGGAHLDDDGRYFDQYSAQKTTALALLVAGMHEAADIYAEHYNESLSVMAATIVRFGSDLDALTDQNPEDRIVLERELLMAETMLLRMQERAPQGTLYGQ
ncbi:MAG: VWA domain-containing protein [Candidatus Eisenbacteria sp.]|nr:VWA domain-containing protein [Candidatus Eisenbacteria bacterium]